MLDTSIVAPITNYYPCTIEPVDQTEKPQGSRWRVRHAKGALTAWSWLPLPPPEERAVRKGYAITLQIVRAGPENLLVAFEQQDLLPLGVLVSETCCPIPGVVRQTTEFVDRLMNPALRRFVSDALLQPVARSNYWRIPASRIYHHAIEGGLAQHCLEIATMVASASGLEDEDRDLGIAYALLHDYGKLAGGQPRGEGMPYVPHEKSGLALLTPLLDRLIAEARGPGLKMRELLGGDRAPRSSPYPLAIGRVVRAFDQLSCEANKRANEIAF
jgi:hypothetical protein